MLAKLIYYVKDTKRGNVRGYPQIKDTEVYEKYMKEIILQSKLRIIKNGSTCNKILLTILSKFT